MVIDTRTVPTSGTCSDEGQRDSGAGDAPFFRDPIHDLDHTQGFGLHRFEHLAVAKGPSRNATRTGLADATNTVFEDVLHQDAELDLHDAEADRHLGEAFVRLRCIVESHAKVPYFPSLLQRGELLPRRRIAQHLVGGAVEEHDVEVVGAQAAETSFDRVGEIARAGRMLLNLTVHQPARHHSHAVETAEGVAEGRRQSKEHLGHWVQGEARFRGNGHLMAHVPVCQDFADHFLAFALAVEVRRVDVVDACIERRIEGIDRLPLAAARLERSGSEAQYRGLHAGVAERTSFETLHHWATPYQDRKPLAQSGVR